MPNPHPTPRPRPQDAEVQHVHLEAVRQRLAELPGLPIAEHGEVFTELHHELSAALARVEH